jgi:hypothetical protein
VCTTSQLLGPLDEVSRFYRRGCYVIPFSNVRVQLNMSSGFGGENKWQTVWIGWIPQYVECSSFGHIHWCVEKQKCVKSVKRNEMKEAARAGVG